MRIVTWNLNHGGGSRAATAAQNELIAAQQADIVILTEPSASSSVPGLASVDSPRQRAGKHGPEAWVRILGDRSSRSAIELPFERMAVAAHVNVDGEALIVYGSVMPWNAARSRRPTSSRTKARQPPNCSLECLQSRSPTSSNFG